MILHLLFRFYLFIVLKIVKGVQFDIERLFGENDRGRNWREDSQCFFESLEKFFPFARKIQILNVVNW